jgi:chitinase
LTSRVQTNTFLVKRPNSRRSLTRAAVAACSLSLLAALAPAAAAQGDVDRHATPSYKLHKPYKRVGYFTQWGVYGRDFQFWSLDGDTADGELMTAVDSGLSRGD